MSFIPVMKYIFGIGVMGFMGWLLNGILSVFTSLNIHVTGETWTFLNYIWAGVFVIYLIFGGLWLIRTYDEEEYQFPRRKGGMY